MVLQLLMEDLPREMIAIVADFLPAKDMVSFAATCRMNANKAKTSAMARAKSVVESNSRQPDGFDSSCFKRNLRLIDAGERKTKVLRKMQQFETHQTNNKLRRLNEEIYWVADGSAPSDVEVVSESEEEE